MIGKNVIINAVGHNSVLQLVKFKRVSNKDGSRNFLLGGCCDKLGGCDNTDKKSVSRTRLCA